MIFENNDFLYAASKKCREDFFLWGGHALFKLNDLLREEDWEREKEFIIDGIAFASSKEEFEKHLQDTYVQSVESSVQGEYSCVVMTEDFAYFFTDPVGANHIYFYHSDTLSIVSNSFEMIYNFILEHKIEHTIDKSAVFNAAFVGCSYYPGTGIQEIKLLEPHQYVFIDRNKKTINLLDRNYWFFLADIAEQKIPYLELIEWCASRLKNKVRHIIEEDSNQLILEITGGYDSRIVLAAFLANGFTDFKINTYGSSTAFDARFSQLISDLYKLEHVSFSRDLSLQAAIEENYLKTCGVYHISDISYLAKRKGDISILGGAYGELCRGTWGRFVFQKKGNGVEKAENFSLSKFSDLYSFFAWNSFLSDEHKEYHSEKALASYSNSPFCCDKSRWADFPLFLTFSRFHFGAQIHNRNRNWYRTYSILNDIVFQALYYYLPFHERSNNKNVHFLLNELCPFLNYFPYSNPPMYNDESFKHSKSLALIQLPDKASYKSTVYDASKQNVPVDNICEDEWFEFFLQEDFSGYFNKETLLRLKKLPAKETIIMKTYCTMYFYSQISKNM